MQKLSVHRGCLLKDFLRDNLKISGARAKQLLDQRKVFVNKQRVWIAGYKLTPGVLVEVQEAAPVQQKPRYVLAAADKEYLLVNKPAGIIVNEYKYSLENKLRADLRNPELRAAHRLDKDTSGLVIFAQTPEAFAAIIPVFQNLGVEKYYRGIAQGNLLTKFPRRFTLAQEIDGQTAETRLKILNANNLASYFEAQIITGRKHQIRLHLSQTGFPLLGEKTYQTKILAQPVYRKIPRQMLHASALSFANPFTGHILSARAEEPEDFQRALKLLKLN